MDETQSNREVKSPGVVPNQAALYAKIASRSNRIIERLFELLESSNENVAASAAKTLFNKILPDKKAVEVTGENGEPIKLIINTGAGFIPNTPVSQPITINASSDGSTFSGQPSVQSTSLAQESQKNDDSPNGDSQTSLPA